MVMGILNMYIVAIVSVNNKIDNNTLYCLNRKSLKIELQVIEDNGEDIYERKPLTEHK